MVTRHHRLVGAGVRGITAFTLIEALLALAISAVVLAAIGGVFFSALRLRDRTFAALNEGSGLQPALNYIKRDLRGALPPDGFLAYTFRCGQLGGLLGENFGLQFVTTTGDLDDDLPKGDLQEVVYMLRQPSNGRRDAGMNLVRLVNRNLMATIPELPPEQLLVSGVQDFRVECYDGYTWRNYWDSTLTDTNLPVAVRVQISVATPEELQNGGASATQRAPVELVVPLLAQSRTNTAGSAVEEAPQ